MNIEKHKEHLYTAQKSVNAFVTATSELPQSILISAVAMILEEVAVIRKRDVIEVTNELQQLVELVNKKYGKYEGEE